MERAEKKDGQMRGEFKPGDTDKLRNIDKLWLNEAKRMGVELSKLDRDCWVVGNVTGELGFIESTVRFSPTANGPTNEAASHSRGTENEYSSTTKNIEHWGNPKL